MATQAVRRLGRLTQQSCYFFLCDMQEKFRPSIRYFPEIITVAQRMVRLRHTLRPLCIEHQQYDVFHRLELQAYSRSQS